MIPGVVASAHADLGVSITDLFGAPNAALHGRTTETGAKTWSVTDGSAMKVQGGYVDATSTPAIGHSVGVVETALADGTVRAHGSAIQESGTGGRHGLVFRYVNDTNHWSVYHYRTAGGDQGLFLRGWSAGAISYDSGFLSLAEGTVDMRAVLLGSSIKLYYNDVLVQNITNALHQTATKHGICSHATYGGVLDFSFVSPSP